MKEDDASDRITMEQLIEMSTGSYEYPDGLRRRFDDEISKLLGRPIGKCFGCGEDLYQFGPVRAEPTPEMLCATCFREEQEASREGEIEKIIGPRPDSECPWRWVVLAALLMVIAVLQIITVVLI